MSQDEKNQMSYDEPIDINYGIPLECIDATEVWPTASPDLLNECIRLFNSPNYWLIGTTYVLPLTERAEREIREYSHETVLPRPTHNIVAIFTDRRESNRAGRAGCVFVFNNTTAEGIVADITRIVNLRAFL